MPSNTTRHRPRGITPANAVTPFPLIVILVLVPLFFRFRLAHAGEIVPWVGITKSVHGDANVTTAEGLALRGNLLPLIQTEIGVGYRSESRFDDQLKVRMWPVTASIYARPLPLFYAGGGVGWYHITFDYANSLPFKDETKQEFGVHLGGGLQVPLAPRVGLDLNGRYVMMRDQQDRLVPGKFDPDFWTTSLGLAIKI